MNDLIISIVNICIVPILLWLTAYFVKLIRTKIDSIQNENLRKFLDSALSEVDNAVDAAVKKVSQTYVESLKKDGKFDINEQKVAFNKAFDAVIEILSEDSIDFLNKQLTSDGFAQLITAKIESAVISNKN